MDKRRDTCPSALFICVYVCIFQMIFVVFSTSMLGGCVALLVSHPPPVHTQKLVCDLLQKSLFIVLPVCVFPRVTAVLLIYSDQQNFSRTRTQKNEWKERDERERGRTRTLLCVIWLGLRKLYIFLFAKDIFHWMNVTFWLLTNCKKKYESLFLM